MSISNGIISAPISANEPYDLLGVPKQKSGWDIGYICKNDHGRINECSKVKPVRHKELSIMTDALFKSTNFGIEFSKANSLSGTNVILTPSKWIYNAPRGGVNEPFRITDFNGYNHKASYPLKMSATEYIFDRGLQSLDDFYITAFYKLSNNISFGGLSNVEINLEDLKLEGITYIQNCYWALAYIENNMIFVANANNNFKQSNGSKTPTVTPSKFSFFKDLINKMKDNEVIELLPVINNIETQAQADAGNASSVLFNFPLGQKIKIKKVFTPVASFIDQQNIGLFNAVTGKNLGFFNVTNITPTFGTIQKSDGSDYLVCMYVTITNRRNTVMYMPASGFALEWSMKTITPDGTGVMWCTEILLNQKNFDFTTPSLSEIPSKEVSIKVGETKSFAICSKVPYAQWNKSFGYVSGVPTRDVVVKPMHLLCESEITRTNRYYYKVGS